MFGRLNLRAVLGLACGKRRHAAQIVDRAEAIILVDVNEENIISYRRRFAERKNGTYFVNNGVSLRNVSLGSVTVFYCYDAMVHFEADAVLAYLAEAYRMLVIGGKAVLRYSNLHYMPGLECGQGAYA